MVILHGLLGSGRNWHTIAQAFADDHKVITVDLRNHGQSPHSTDMGYAELVGDVSDLLQQQPIEPVHLVGHSLGGKVAMALALTYPQVVRTLTVVDIAPATYHDRYSAILQSMKRIALDAAPSRSAIDRQLSRWIPAPELRQFLMTNLVREAAGFRWRVNLDPLQSALPELLSFPELDCSTRFTNPTLFIAGARSDYIGPGHHAEIRRLFPDAQVDVIQNAGHWPHFDHPQGFNQSLRSFLRTWT